MTSRCAQAQCTSAVRSALSAAQKSAYKLLFQAQCETGCWRNNSPSRMPIQHYSMHGTSYQVIVHLCAHFPCIPDFAKLLQQWQHCLLQLALFRDMAIRLWTKAATLEGQPGPMSQ